MKETTGPQEPMSNRVLVRDVAVFQFKLIVDGLRDFILVPISLFAGLLSFVSGKDGKPNSQFYSLLEAGKQSEQWIDLFGALRNAPADMQQRVRARAMLIPRVAEARAVGAPQDVHTPGVEIPAIRQFDDHRRLVPLRRT